MNEPKVRLDYLIFIPARDNSKRVPNKNMRLLDGKPLLEYTVDVAESVSCHLEANGKKCHVVVSTNSSDIRDSLRRYYDTGVYLRPQKMAMDHIQTDEVFLEYLRELEYCSQSIDMSQTIGILLQPTSPSRTVKDVLGCIDYADYLMSQDAELETYKTWSVISAEQADGFYWKQENVGLAEPYNCINNDPRFRLGKQWINDPNPLMKENGAVYVFPMRNLSLYRTYRMPPYFLYETEPMIDVDTEDDFVLAEMKMKRQAEKE